MCITVRCAKPEDLDAAFAVETAAFVPEESATYEAYRQRIAAFPKTFLLAQCDERIVGVLNSGCWDHPYFEDILYQDIGAHKPDGLYRVVYGLGVIPQYEKRGIATMLLRHLIAIALEEKKQGVVLSCKDTLVDFYGRFGFVPQGKSKSDLGGACWNDMLLRF